MSNDAEIRMGPANVGPHDNVVEEAGRRRSTRHGAPDDFAKRYTVQQTALGGAWYYTDPEKREFAFRDRGHLLSTRLEGSVANSDTVSKIGLMYCQGQLR